METFQFGGDNDPTGWREDSNSDFGGCGGLNKDGI